MKTSFFTFGQSHAHRVNGFIFDKDIVLKITATDPRLVTVGLFGDKWAFEYDAPPPMSHFPRGIVELNFCPCMVGTETPNRVV